MAFAVFVALSEVRRVASMLERHDPSTHPARTGWYDSATGDFVRTLVSEGALDGDVADEVLRLRGLDVEAGLIARELAEKGADAVRALLLSVIVLAEHERDTAARARAEIIVGRTLEYIDGRDVEAFEREVLVEEIDGGIVGAALTVACDAARERRGEAEASSYVSAGAWVVRYGTERLEGEEACQAAHRALLALVCCTDALDGGGRDPEHEAARRYLDGAR